jgi:hypothetical protein
MAFVPWPTSRDTPASCGRATGTRSSSGRSSVRNWRTPSRRMTRSSTARSSASMRGAGATQEPAVPAQVALPLCVRSTCGGRRGLARVAAGGTQAPAAAADSVSADQTAVRGSHRRAWQRFFQVACAHDLEGIVAKPVNGRYHSGGTGTNSIKIKNAGYTQMTARHELFERRTGSRRRRPMV